MVVVVNAGVAGMLFSRSSTVSGEAMVSDLVRRELDEIIFKFSFSLLLGYSYRSGSKRAP